MTFNLGALAGKSLAATERIRVSSQVAMRACLGGLGIETRADSARADDFRDDECPACMALMCRATYLGLPYPPLSSSGDHQAVNPIWEATR